MAGNLVISQFNWLKILEYAKQCPTEISGFGSIILNGDGDAEVNELFPLLNQECTGVETAPDLLPLVQSPFSKRVGLWWHSHVNMDCFWSPTDEACIAELGETKLNYLLSIVVNKRGEYKARFDYFKPYPMFMDDLKVEVQYKFPQKEISSIAREIKDKVRKPVYVQPFQQYQKYPKGNVYVGVWPTSAPTVVTTNAPLLSNKRGSEDTKHGILDDTISLSAENDMLKFGYKWDRVSRSWYYPSASQQ